jgi:hypothetical protein
MNKTQQLKEIWKQTHKDYKGLIDGARMIMILRNGATRLVKLDELTDEEISKQLRTQP